MKRAIELAAVATMLAPLLSGCGGKTLPSENAQHDVRTEARREEDCANPQWKAANLGLWYNLCQTDTY